MKAVGVVTNIENEIATVVSQRSSACSSCHNCEAKGACHAELVFGSDTQEIVVKANNKVGAKIGDRVEFESETLGTLLSSFAVFVVPFFITLVAYFFFEFIDFRNNFLPLVLILVYLTGFFLIGKILNKYIYRRISICIVKILEESLESFEAE